MAYSFADIAFTPAVRHMQEVMGSRNAYARVESSPDARGTALGPQEAAFLDERDSFYLATVGETGWPYVQHRGGPSGFVRVLDEKTLGFADFAGNRQYVSAGNLQTSDRVSLIFMDYAGRRRLKLLGRAEIVEASNPLVAGKLSVSGYRARIERGVLIHVEAFDWNCPQHITPRFTPAEVEAATAPLRRRIEELETRLKTAGA